MQLPLDTLLFWAGLGLLSVGIYVFITGKSTSEEKKQQSNRFEAFGIKIDVNNPSLILIILGVVMMLAPKLMPQSSTEPDQPEAIVETNSSTTPATQVPGRSLVQTETTQQEAIEPISQPTRPKQPEPAADPVPSTTASTTIGPTVLETSQVAMQPKRDISTETIEKPVIKPIVQKPAPAVTQLQPPKAPVKAVSKLTPSALNKPAPAPKPEPSPTVSTTIRPTVQRASQVAIQPKRDIPTKTIKKPIVRPIVKRPAPAVTQLQSPKIPTKTVNKPAPATLNKPAPAPPKPNLIVLVQADVDGRAGINGSAETYNKQISAELASLAQDMFGDNLNIKQQAVKALRRVLKQEASPYQTLCRRVDAGRLLVADLEVPFSLSNVASSYWPDLELHLVNCDTGRKQRRVKTHLNPKNRDHFPFQQAIREVTTNFVADFRYLVVN